MNLTNDIAQFFAALPHINDHLGTRKALIYRMNPDDELVRRIEFASETRSFCRKLTRVLTTYGAMQDGRDPLDAVLAALEGNIDSERQAECDRLRQRWREVQISRRAWKSRLRLLLALLTLFAIAGGAFLLKDRLTNHDDPNENRANIFGTVQNENGDFLEKARARIGFVQTVTNENGEFELALPPNQQNDQYTLIIEKAGYRIWERKIFPDGKPLSIILQGE